MDDREKVIKGLECCANEEVCGSVCPYFKKFPMADEYCVMALLSDALALLKEQDRDAQLVAKCRDGGTVKYVGNGIVLMNYEWWKKILREKSEFQIGPNAKDLLSKKELRTLSRVFDNIAHRYLEAKDNSAIDKPLPWALYHEWLDQDVKEERDGKA